MATTKEPKGGKADVVRFNVYLPREAYATLERLREMSGKRSLAETIRSAVQLYMAIQEELDDGNQLMVENKQSGDRKRLRLIPM